MGIAVVLDTHGGPEAFRLEERDPPEPGPGEIVIANEAVGLNFIDIYQRTGLYPVALPAVLGMEGAGTVAAVGEHVRAFKEGDRAACLSAGGGGYASHTVVAAGMAAPLPAAISSERAAAAFLKGLTADMLIRQVHRLKAGERALVYAAAGGVGSLLVQWAAALGADVIAVVGTEEKAALARSYGARRVILRTKTDSIAGEARKLTDGRGVDVVYDSVGAATFEASLDALAMRGMMVTYGNASGPPPPVAPLDLARRGSLSLCRPTLFHYAQPGRLQEMAARLFEAMGSGAVAPAAPRCFALKDIADAHRLLESGESTGSIILTP